MNDVVVFSFSLRSTRTKLDQQRDHVLVQSTNRNTRKMCEICSKLTIKTPDGVIQKFVLGGGSTKQCDNGCDQALIKSIWGSV